MSLSMEEFDCIVSNPHYIESEVIQGLEPEVRDVNRCWHWTGKEDGSVFLPEDYKRSKELSAAGRMAAV